MGFSYKATGVDNLIQQLQQAKEYFLEEAGEYERQFVIELNRRILALTPVWEGESIVNYVWSVGSPIFVTNLALGADDPGHTNDMALGAEPRRAENEAAVRETLARVLAAKLPQNIYLTNSAPEIVPLEYGLNPTPQTSRVKSGGMVRMAVIEATQSLHGI